MLNDAIQRRDHVDVEMVRWLALSPGRDGIGVYLHDVEDVGTDTFWDITEFPPLDPDDETFGKIAAAATPDEALEVAEHGLGADPAKWVNQGIACSEYGDYQAARTNRSKQHTVIMSLVTAPGRSRAGTHAAHWVPDYLAFDDSRALARKAIHALGKTPGSEAEQALTQLTDSDSEIVRETARRVLERRQNH